MQETTVMELKEKIEANEPFLLLDVREPHEHAFACIPGSKLLPLGEIAQRFLELPRNRPIVVMCRSGGRSVKAVKFLEENGFSNISNLKGGILAWSDQIDSTVPKY